MCRELAQQRMGNWRGEGGEEREGGDGRGVWRRRRADEQQLLRAGGGSGLRGRTPANEHSAQGFAVCNLLPRPPPTRCRLFVSTPSSSPSSAPISPSSRRSKSEIKSIRIAGRGADGGHCGGSGCVGRAELSGARRARSAIVVVGVVDVPSSTRSNYHPRWVAVVAVYGRRA